MTTCPHCGHEMRDEPVAVVRRAADIIEAVRRFYDIPPHEMCGPSRLKTFAHGRQVAMYLIRKNTMLSFESIGKMLGERHHTTCMHGAAVAEAWAATPDGAAAVKRIEAMI